MQIDSHQESGSRALTSRLKTSFKKYHRKISGNNFNLLGLRTFFLFSLLVLWKILIEFSWSEEQVKSCHFSRNSVFQIFGALYQLKITILQSIEYKTEKKTINHCKRNVWNQFELFICLITNWLAGVATLLNGHVNSICFLWVKERWFIRFYLLHFLYHFYQIFKNQTNFSHITFYSFCK